MDAMTTKISRTGKPWIDCTRCEGTGVKHFIHKTGENAGRPGSGPCYLCEGTGDGNIRNYTNPHGWRRPYGKKGSRRIPQNIFSVPTETTTETTEDEGDEEDEEDTHDEPRDTQGAAAKLAEALQGLMGSQPVDERMVRRIVNEAMEGAKFGLAQLVRDTRNALTEAQVAIADIIAQAPRKLEIIIGDHTGELPPVRHKATEDLLMLIAANIPVSIVGPAGSGKTTAAEQVAQALGLPFYLQGAMSGAHEILGFVNAHGHYQTTPWRQAYERGGVLLLDEIDGTIDPAALLTANAGIANGHMSFPDRAEPIKRHPDFRIIAAANTFGMGSDRRYVGRTQLDAATLDRFATLVWDYDETLERLIAGDNDWTTFVQNVRRAVDDCKMDYVVSPRASIFGNRMLSAGMAREKVEAMFIWRGMTADDQARVRGRMN